jgi:hypothetical protein
MLIVAVGVVTLLLVPLVWGLLRRNLGLPMRGRPTVQEIDEPVAPAQDTAAR